MRLSYTRFVGGSVVPWYYGLVYHDHMKFEYVFYYIPFNYLIRWWRFLIYHWNSFWRIKSFFDKQQEILYNKAYKLGYDSGRRDEILDLKLKIEKFEIENRKKTETGRKNESHDHP